MKKVFGFPLRTNALGNEIIETSYIFQEGNEVFETPQAAYDGACRLAEKWPQGGHVCSLYGKCVIDGKTLLTIPTPVVVIEGYIFP